MLGDRVNGFEASLPETLQSLVEDRLERARAERWSRRLWAGDATLWTGGDEDRWLGWLAAGRGAAVDLEALSEFAAEAREYEDIVLLGMGGSSLGPEVIGRVLGSAPGHPALHVLDSSDPGQIAHGRRSDRSGAHPVHRLQQIRFDDGAGAAANLFLRSGQASGRRGRSRETLRRGHRSRLGSGEDREGRTGSPMSLPAIRRSADAIPCCRPSEWCPRQRSASTSPPFSPPRGRWSFPAAPTFRRRPIPACGSARSSAKPQRPAATS